MRHFNFYCFILILTSYSIAAAEEKNPKAAVVPLVNAHAHNDYHHQRPLLDALASGFCSVEADIFLVKGGLLVGHSIKELNPKRTLASLYLDPLRKRIRDNNGRVYRNGPEFTLLIDVKTDSKKTYAALAKVLAKYDDILTKVEDGKLTKKAVVAIISGNRDWQQIKNNSPRYAGIDGRLGDLKSKHPNHFMPLISDHWGRHFSWRGQGKMPADQRQKLHSIVKQSHAAGYRLRFWATPESPALWKELRAAKVDLIGTDKLTKLQTFLLPVVKNKK